MAAPSAARLTALLRTGQPATRAIRPLSTATQSSVPRSNEKRFVRIAGPASYATRRDVELFLQSHGIVQTTAAPTMDLVQGQADVFQNQSVWIYDAGSAAAATDVSARISGRIAGLKLIRAAPVDRRLVDDMMAVPDNSSARRASLRKRMNIIKPKTEERGRALLATNLPINLSPRFLWSFFAAYDIEDVRHLRRSGVACVVFTTEEEAYRAMRERTNLPIQSNKHHISLKMHE